MSAGWKGGIPTYRTEALITDYPPCLCRLSPDDIGTMIDNQQEEK
jgi:hypothetical protein